MLKQPSGKGSKSVEKRRFRAETVEKVVEIAWIWTMLGPYELTDWLCEQGRFGMKTPDPKIKADGRGIFIHRGRDKA